MENEEINNEGLNGIICTGECLSHSASFKQDFKRCLKLLKGKAIPRRIAKRVGYLVCNCTADHTELDDIYCESELDFKGIKESIDETLVDNVDCEKSSTDTSLTQTVGDIQLIDEVDAESAVENPSDAQNNASHQECDYFMDTRQDDIFYKDCSLTKELNVTYSDKGTLHDWGVGESEETKNCPCSITSPNFGGTQDSRNCCCSITSRNFDDVYYIGELWSDPVTEEISKDNNDNNKVIRAILDCDTNSKEDIPGGIKRLLVIIHLCLKRDTRRLEPHRGERKESRITCKYREIEPEQKKKRKKKPPRYPTVRIMVIENCPLNAALFIGKQGKNVRNITLDLDCRIEVFHNTNSFMELEITVYAKTEVDYDVIKRRIIQAYTSLVYDHNAIQRKRELHMGRMVQYYLINELRKDQGKYPTRPGRSRWDLDEETKEGPRDQFEKKYHHSQRKRTTKVKPESEVHGEETRCLHCGCHYDKGEDKPTDCIYHPGYIDKDSRWTCCSKVFQTVYPGTDQGPHDVDGQRRSHKFNGCTAGGHKWRIHTNLSTHHKHSKKTGRFLQYLCDYD